MKPIMKLCLYRAFGGLVMVTSLTLTGCMSSPVWVSGLERTYVTLYYGTRFQDVHEWRHQAKASKDQLPFGFMGAGIGSVTVKAEFQKEGIEIEVEASPTEESKTGIKLIRNGEWIKARSSFNKAMEMDSNDHRSAFALAVCREMIGDSQYRSIGRTNAITRRAVVPVVTEYEASLESYRHACIILDAPPTRYSASRDRVEKKLDLLTARNAELPE